VTTPTHPVVRLDQVQDGYNIEHFYLKDLIAPFEFISPYMNTETKSLNSTTITNTYSGTPINNNSVTYTNLLVQEKSTLVYSEKNSEWSCQLFGTGDTLVLTPKKGKEPNWFWRKMQYLCFGNKWYKTTLS
jgi:hypothetical protein